MKKLSVITINYNDAAGLEKTVASVVGQAWKEFEYIVIDGGSTDGSAAVLEKYRDRIDICISEKDQGIYDAQNKGLKKASGEYCLFLNSGDYLVNDAVLKDAFSIPFSEDIVYGNMIIDWGPNQTLGRMPDTVTFGQLYHDTIWHPVSFIKRALLDELGGYNQSYRMVADYEFFFHALIIRNASSRHIDLPISVYNTQGLSSDPKRKEQEKAERRRVLSSYLPPKLVEFLEKEIKEEKKTNTSIGGFLRSVFKS
jgi:glycosyltransferase involved in cell wall biosynthesis